MDYVWLGRNTLGIVCSLAAGLNRSERSPSTKHQQPHSAHTKPSPGNATRTLLRLEGGHGL